MCWRTRDIPTNSMEQSPSWEADSHSASQEIPRLLWNPKVHYRVYNSPPFFPLLRQMNPVHDFPPYFRKIHSNIILPSTPRSSEWSPPFRFSDQNFVWTFPYVLHAPQSHLPSFDRPNMSWSVKVMRLLIMMSSPASRLFPPSYVHLSTLFSKHPQSMFFP
jgi:hypothetical protein